MPDRLRDLDPRLSQRVVLSPSNPTPPTGTCGGDRQPNHLDTKKVADITKLKCRWDGAITLPITQRLGAPVILNYALYEIGFSWISF
jgi:hypothetical protein